VSSYPRQTQPVESITDSSIDKLRLYTRELDVIVAASAWRDLARQLKDWLSIILRSALSAKVAIAGTSKKTAPDEDQQFSISFGMALSELSLTKFYNLLPGAKQTVETVISDWIRAQRLMLSRLQRDRSRLSAILAGRPGKRVQHVRPGLSDPHDRGQTVTILQFSNGSRVVYKPRPCEGERIWFSVLQWLNDRGFEPFFYIPKLISRRDYCWMSFVDHRGCISSRGVKRFYFRWGAQAAVAQLLGCADLHRQNWVASGQHPVLVDAEMLGDAFAGDGGGSDAVTRLHPVLRTGLLPLIETDGVGRYTGIAPFDCSAHRKERNVFWPVYRGRVERPEKHIDDIADGFSAASRFICASPNRKLFERFVRQAASRTNLRVLRRATAQYRQLLDASLHPRHLQNRGDRLRYLLESCGRTQAGRIEANALLRCSIPRFEISRRVCERRSALVPTLRTMINSTNLLAARLLIPRSRRPA
jgi:lantibiotic modifying enzyme